MKYLQVWLSSLLFLMVYIHNVLVPYVFCEFWLQTDHFSYHVIGGNSLQPELKSREKKLDSFYLHNMLKAALTWVHFIIFTWCFLKHEAITWNRLQTHTKSGLLFCILGRDYPYLLPSAQTKPDQFIFLSGWQFYFLFTVTLRV